jgi:tripartite-type tricarboxylate transporter receptor subunit TctC
MRRLAFLLLLVCFQTAMAQTYPNRPVKIVIGFTPGGGVDINARLLASKLTEYLGQSVIVENKPGAGTNIGAEFVARSAATSSRISRQSRCSRTAPTSWWCRPRCRRKP